MKKFAFSMLLLTACCVAAVGQQFPKDSLLYNGSVNKLINLVILPDGYTSAELPKFKTDATAFMNYFFTQLPFSRYKNYFNVYTINVPSKQSGVIHPHTAPDCGGDVAVTNPDIYFKSTMDYAGIHRLLVANSSIVNTTLMNNFPQWDIVLMIVNTTKYGGAGGTFAFTTNGSSGAKVALHEIGHVFGNLRDEYYPGASFMVEQTNTTKESSSALVRWKNWIGTYSTGVYQFAEDTTWHRPHRDCRMRNIEYAFCPYCNELNIEKIHTITNPIDSYTPTSTTVDVATSKIPFTISTVKPIPNTLKVIWMLDGIEYVRNQDTITLASATLAEGIHMLVAMVIDTTKSVRAAMHATTHLYSLQWTINNLSTNISINAQQFKTLVSFYPNPFEDNITVAYTLEKASNVRVDLMAINGALLQTLVKQNNVAGGEYEKTVNIAAHNLPAGIYLIRFTIDGYSYTKQIVKG